MSNFPFDPNAGGFPLPGDEDLVSRSEARQLRDEGIAAERWRNVQRWAEDQYYAGRPEHREHREVLGKHMIEYVTKLPEDRRRSLAAELTTQQIGPELSGLYNHVADATEAQVGRRRRPSPEEELQAEFQRQATEQHRRTRRQPGG
jgi:hypothetical protein